MAIPITIPRLGWTMEEGVFVGWLKRDGETVRPGDLIYALESDKATQEIECMDGGILRIPAKRAAAWRYRCGRSAARLPLGTRRNGVVGPDHFQPASRSRLPSRWPLKSRRR